MWQFPPVPPDYPTDKIKEGDRVRVKPEIPIYSGRIGIAKEVHDAIGEVQVEFKNGETATYDFDMIYKYKSNTK